MPRPKASKTRTRAAARRVRAGNATARTAPLDKFWDTESFLALSDAEKEQVWRSLNREIPADETSPLNAAQRRQWARIKRKGGRPKLGKGARVISVSVEGGLLERADAYAKERGLTRAQLVARGLTLAMAG